MRVCATIGYQEGYLVIVLWVGMSAMLVISVPLVAPSQTRKILGASRAGSTKRSGAYASQ